jgi:uncharacterized protein YndB with AHSA1/START domain
MCFSRCGKPLTGQQHLCGRLATGLPWRRTGVEIVRIRPERWLACFLGALALAFWGIGNIARKAPVLVHEVALDHPSEAVWRAITRKSAVDRYDLAPLGADIGAPGDDIFYGTAAQKLITGRVLEADAPRRLVHTFRFAGRDEPTSEVAYVLTPIAGRTRLRIEHRGYARGSQRHADVALGWPIITDGLAAYLAGRR